MQRQGSAMAGAFAGTRGPASGRGAQHVVTASRRPRSMRATHLAAGALYWLADLARAAARGLHTAAGHLDAWLERRRIAAAALRDLRTMSERELLDIGLTRVDVHRVAWGASHR